MTVIWRKDIDPRSDHLLLRTTPHSHRAFQPQEDVTTEKFAQHHHNECIWFLHDILRYVAHLL